MSVPINRFYTTFLRIPGGSADLNVDGSTVPVNATITIPVDTTFFIYSYQVYILANRTISNRGFAGSNQPLTNGLFFDYVEPGPTTIAVPVRLPGEPLETIRYNGDFGSYVGARIDVLQGRTLIAQWAAGELCSGRPLSTTEGGVVRMVIQDDLSNLERFRVSISGLSVFEDDDPARFVKEVRNNDP